MGIIDLVKIKKVLKINPKNEKIWQEALTHKSWLYLHPEHKLSHNERLEFLGDSILQTITSIYLYQNFKNLSEGEMSLIRSKLVSRDRLNKIALKMKLNEIVLIGKVPDKKGIKTILGNALEAIIGAIFLDLGWRETVKFVDKFILKSADKIIKEKKYKDSKTLLQEIFLQKYHKLPEYRLVEVSGPSHKQKFKIEVYLDNKKIGEGEGSSKQSAEINAAKKILEEIYKNKEF